MSPCAAPIFISGDLRQIQRTIAAGTACKELMPTSLRRWFGKTIRSKATENRSAVDESIPPRQLPPSERFRPARYPRLAAGGCVVLIGLCSYIFLSRVLVPAPVSTVSPTLDAGVLATSA